MTFAWRKTVVHPETARTMRNMVFPYAVHQYGGLDIRIQQIYSYYRSASLHEHREPPQKPEKGLLKILAYFFTVGWILTLLITVFVWVLIVTRFRAPTGMRLLGLIPVAGFLEPPDDQFEANTVSIAERLEQSDEVQRNALIRFAYTVVAGWWLSGVVLMLSWLLLLTIIGVRYAPALYRNVPFYATLARY